MRTEAEWSTQAVQARRASPPTVVRPSLHPATQGGEALPPLWLVAAFCAIVGLFSIPRVAFGAMMHLWYGRPHFAYLYEPISLKDGKTLSGDVMRRRNRDGTWSYRDLDASEVEAVRQGRMW